MTRRLAAIAALLLGGCVQPAYDRTVVYELVAPAVTDSQQAGVRGDDSPLSWQKDLPLVRAPGDSLFRGTVTYRTGFLKTEVKFTVNGAFELVDAPNRRVVFTGDTTVFRARYNDAAK